MVLIAVGLAIAIKVDPVVADMTHTIDAVLVGRMKITRVAGSPMVARMLADGALC